MGRPVVFIVGRQRGESGPHAVEVDAQATKDLPRRPFDVKKAEQDVSGLDLLVVPAQRESRRSLQSSLGPIGELEIVELAGALAGHRLGDLVPDPSRVAPAAARARAALSSVFAKIPSRRCSVPMWLWPRRVASSSARSTACRAAWLNRSSTRRQ